MPSLNQVTLIGHLGRDPETKVTPSGASVTNFSIATSKSWKDKQTEEWKEETQWHNIVAWRLSEKQQSQLKKGALAFVSGELKTRSYENKDGQQVKTTEIVADTVYYLRDKNGDGPKPAGAAAKSDIFGDDESPF